MAGYVQQNRKIRVTTPVGEDVLLLKAFSGTEEISRPFRFQVEMIAENKKKVAFDAMLGEKVTVHLLLADESTEHHFNGVCVRFSQAGRDEEFTVYRAELVPEFQLLSHKAQSRIFQRKNVPDILKEVMKGVTVDWQLEGQYEKRDFCVQYRETDFNFASRLMEEEGIFYFFQHEDGKHTMIVADSPAAFPALPGESEITYEELSGGVREDNRIWAWERMQEARSTKSLLWDHTFELPHKHLEAESPLLDSVQAGKETHKLKIKGSGAWELYDWPGEYAQRFDGINRSGGEQQGELQKIFQDNGRTVGIRMDEEATLAVQVRGTSNVKHFVAGHKLNLKRHFSGDGAYVLSSVSHRASYGADYRSGKDPLLAYQNEFTCFPSSLPFRPKRITAKPVVQGSQSAVVVGPKGEEIFTDKYGRVKVQFHWDREGKNDEDSSTWLRVGQLAAGRRWGASYWPRIGQEVIVDFFEGDPDQPIIVGTVYNAEQMPPYLGQGPDAKHKNDNKVSGFKSNTTKGGQGFNELRFDDTKDKQQVFVHAEKNMDTRVKNDSMESVLHDKHLTVGGTKDGKNVGDYRELVYRDVHLHNKRNLTQHVGGDIQLLVGGEDGDGNLDEAIRANRTTTIGGNRNEHVKGNDLRMVDGSVGRQINGSRQAAIAGNEELKVAGSQNEQVSGKTSLSVGGDRHAKVGGSDAVEAAMEIHLKAGMKVVLEAGLELTLKGPGGFVKIDPMGVTINGNLVLINSGGSPGSGSGASPEGPGSAGSPPDAKEAKPEDPTVADDAKTGQKSN
ncbi:MAG: type VI secretion system tip protein VgrG [Holophagales bacterium]|nr:type VI secretion system tip protein VgrG [Holophagales bacterium]MBK9967625.1 type VI secretion system tip protein VgrG [Holophagales bacterium]